MMETPSIIILGSPDLDKAACIKSFQRDSAKADQKQVPDSKQDIKPIPTIIVILIF